MTTTDIGILLIVLCILLWAIMAALHRHTVQLEALKTQMQELLKNRQADPTDAATSSRASTRHDDDARTATQPPSEPAILQTRRTLSK